MVEVWKTKDGQEFELTLQRNGKQEERMTCPVCSPQRKKKNEKCLSINTADNVGHCNHCNVAFYKPEDNTTPHQNGAIQFKEFTEKDLQYWDKYGITADILKQYGVKSVARYKGHDITLGFAFPATSGSYKVLQPNSEKFKWNWSGDKPSDWYYGYSQLQKPGAIVFITGGEKDVMTLRAQGVNAIALNSETATEIDSSLLDALRANYSNIAILYDKDDTGRKYSAALAAKYDLDQWELPEDMKGKDISDLIAEGRSFNEVERKVTKHIKSAKQRQQQAAKLPPLNFLTGSLVREKEVTIIAGDNNVGKSILAMNIADHISKGKGYLEQENEAGSVKVLYYDLELSEEQYYERVGNHTFHDNFLFVVPDVSVYSFDQMKLDIKETGAQVVIIDNMTALSQHNIVDQDQALEVMRGVNEIKKRMGVAMVLIAHTPKLPDNTPLSKNHVSGSKKVTDLADSIFFIGASSQGREVKYIKQVKTRYKHWVEPFTITHQDSEDGMATFEYVEPCDETEHFVQKEKIPEEHQMILELKNKQGKSLREIAEIVNLTHTQVSNIIKKYSSK